MSKGIIRLGDSTSHGGTVISVSSTMMVDGKKVTLVGDLVSCPQTGHGVNPIIEGSSGWMTVSRLSLMVAYVPAGAR